MRIIRGKFKTRRYSIPKKFPSRPTTDFAKEGLFNVLENRMYLEDLNILDLCFGTGNISIEFLSREAGKLTSVDQNYNCIKHLKKVCHELNCLEDITIIKSEAIKFLSKTENSYDIIFADPPYDFKDHQEIHTLVENRKLLKKNGVLVIEHGKKTSLEGITHFQFMRIYGNVCFSFFFEE